jgi:hypothetical protein
VGADDLQERGSIVAAFYYFLLKLLANFVIFTIPIFALYKSFTQLLCKSPLAYVSICFAAFAFVPIVIQELRHIYLTCCRYWRGDLPINTR